MTNRNFLCILINNPCKSKPSELNCYSDCRDCCTDRWQWQIMIRRTILESAYTNTVMELKLFQFGFTTTISTLSCIAYHYRRARSRGLLICKEIVLLYFKVWLLHCDILSSCWTSCLCLLRSARVYSPGTVERAPEVAPQIQRRRSCQFELGDASSRPTAQS
jgi:hypothetical protein